MQGSTSQQMLHPQRPQGRGVPGPGGKKEPGTWNRLSLGPEGELRAESLSAVRTSASGEPVEGFEPRPDEIKFTCSFWLLWGEQSVKGQAWVWGRRWEPGAPVRVRGEGCWQRGSCRGDEEQAGSGHAGVGDRTVRTC